MAIQFNNTTDRNGIIQIIERRTGLGVGTISGDASGLLKDFTSEVNLAFDEVMPIVYSADSKWQWDDSNHTKDPIGTTTLTQNVRKYNFTADEDGNSILEIVSVYCKDPVSGDYYELTPIDEAEDNTHFVSSETGKPAKFDKMGTAIILDVLPEQTIAAGLKILFKRYASVFASNATTKTPGIPEPFQALLPEIASRNWLEVNKSEDVVRLNGINTRIDRMKADLTRHLNRRSHEGVFIRGARMDYR